MYTVYVRFTTTTGKDYTVQSVSQPHLEYHNSPSKMHLDYAFPRSE